KGVATGLVSVPLRYMHTPAEVLSLKDLDATCDLLVEFIYLLREGMSFIPE
ncbi:MAG: M42 family peptidase, partial [Deltaproteobacteria bacterium]|nr:M42 family peptidase [Deltaproteobacteria bacterium]